MTLPLVRHLAPNTQSSLISIQNATGNQNNVTLTSYRADGSLDLTRSVSFKPYGAAYFNTNTLYKNNTFTGSVKITSAHAVAASVQSLLFQDTTSFPALSAASESKDLFINLVERRMTGGIAQTWNETYVRNNGTAATDIIIQYFAAGKSAGKLTIPNVPPNGIASFLTQDAAHNALGNAFTGWAKVTSIFQGIAVVSVKGKNGAKVVVSANTSTLKGSKTTSISSYGCTKLS